MRRTFGVALVSALLLSLLALPAMANDATADVSSVDGQLVLAAAGGDLGPEPQPRLAEDNQARELAGYSDQEVPFTWGAAWILTFAGTVGLTLLVSLYWLLVHRPSRQVS